jgi:peptidyl-prolyl cis-trans isomerase SurA
MTAMVRRLLARTLLGLWAACLPAFAQEAAPVSPPVADPAAPILVDRVMAVVDEDPILASDLERVIRLKLVERAAGESDQALRRRVLEQMIDDRLRFHEIDRFGFQQVPVEQIASQVEEIRSRFPNPQDLDRELAALDLDLAALRQLVARQLLVLDYVEERLGPRVFVSPDDVRDYYDTTLTSEAARRGAAPPPLDDVRDQVRSLLREQRLNQEIDRWTEELREQADIVSFIDREDRRLPPVVHRITQPATPPG